MNGLGGEGGSAVAQAHGMVDQFVLSRLGDKHRTLTAYEVAVRTATGRSRRLRYLRERTGFIPHGDVINAMADELVDTAPLEMLVVTGRNGGVRMPANAVDIVRLAVKIGAELDDEDERSVLQVAQHVATILRGRRR